MKGRRGGKGVAVYIIRLAQCFGWHWCLDTIAPPCLCLVFVTFETLFIVLLSLDVCAHSHEEESVPSVQLYLTSTERFPCVLFPRLQNCSDHTF